MGYNKTRRAQKLGNRWRRQSISSSHPELQDLTGTHNVFNYSSRVVTIEETSLLSKGVNLFPLKHFNSFETIVDINKFIRNLAIKKHYFNADTDS